MNKSTDNPSSVNAKQLDKLIENQNEAYFKVFDALTEMSPEERVTILNDNKQFVPKSVDEVTRNDTTKQIQLDFDHFCLFFFLTDPTSLDGYHRFWCIGTV